MIYILVGAAVVWAAIAIPFGLTLGRMIREAEENRPRPATLHLELVR